MAIKVGSFFKFLVNLEIVKMVFFGCFFGLYGPLKGRERREMWEELASIKGL